VAGLGAINLTGNALSQTLYGNNGVNALYGGDGNDSIYGFAGADALYGGTGNDSLVGGADNDLYFVDSATDVVVEIAGGGTADRVFTSVNYTLAAGADIEILSTTSVAGFAPISLTGNALSQTIYGNAGANAMYGGGGNDSMYGFDGADTLNGGLGTDSLVGGNDSDWFFVDSQTDVVIELAGGGTADRVFASTSYVLSTTADIEVLSTTSNAGLTAINLTGNGLSQTIYGNDGTNVLNGGGGNDTIYGLGGTDTLNGGTGSDSLNGGLGADAFVFDTALGATNIDTIGNYTVVDDVIRLSSLIFTGLGSGVALAAGAFASNTTGLAVLSTDHIIYQSNTGALFFDVDGFGGVAGKQFATITANLAGFGAGEFFMV
jgi:Ca2+-binding RTX toxin-like protein